MISGKYRLINKIKLIHINFFFFENLINQFIQDEIIEMID
jgi:hypothetical protein